MLFNILHNIPPLLLYLILPAIIFLLHNYSQIFTNPSYTEGSSHSIILIRVVISNSCALMSVAIPTFQLNVYSCSLHSLSCLAKPLTRAIQLQFAFPYTYTRFRHYSFIHSLYRTSLTKHRYKLFRTR
jgi:hypothetical protein